MVVGSIVSSPSLKFGVSSVFPIVSIWLFSFPNLNKTRKPVAPAANGRKTTNTTIISYHKKVY